MCYNIEYMKQIVWTLSVTGTPKPMSSNNNNNIKISSTCLYLNRNLTLVVLFHLWAAPLPQPMAHLQEQVISKSEYLLIMLEKREILWREYKALSNSYHVILIITIRYLFLLNLILTNNFISGDPNTFAN